MSLVFSLRSLPRLRHSLIALNCRHSSTRALHQAKQSDPLRILFCGSDEFSIASLRSLVELQKQRKGLIKSIDVVCRRDKRIGRGLKKLSQIPIKKEATALGLPVHQIDRFVSADPDFGFGPDIWKYQINLVVAVSFGLLIPAPLIKSAKYGGLNLHPSLLPDFRGAAPIPYTLLHSRSHTGVTLQTLHPTKFDHGQILAQTDLPGIAVPKDTTPFELTKLLSNAGSVMLRDAIDNLVFVPPFAPILRTPEEVQQITGGKGIALAPKIQSSHREIDWSGMTAPEIVHRLHVFGKLWDETVYQTLDPCEAGLRINYESLRTITDDPELAEIGHLEAPPGSPFLLEPSETLAENRVGVRAKDGTAIEVLECTVAGKTANGGVKELIRLLRRQVPDAGYETNYRKK